MKTLVQQGTVYWITGLSGAGKTTISNLLYDELRKIKPNVVLLDGDPLRHVLSEDLSYTAADRCKSAARFSRLCKLLSTQGIDVVCATISMIHACRQWNRENISNYCEIFLKADLETLLKRDHKDLYKKALRGEIKDVVGIDIVAEEPLRPDILIENDGRMDPQEILELIWSRLFEPEKMNLKSQNS